MTTGMNAITCLHVSEGRQVARQKHPTADHQAPLAYQWSTFSKAHSSVLPALPLHDYIIFNVWLHPEVAPILTFCDVRFRAAIGVTADSNMSGAAIYEDMDYARSSRNIGVNLGSMVTRATGITGLVSARVIR
jgi:hypothetical protein